MDARLKNPGRPTRHPHLEEKPLLMGHAKGLLAMVIDQLLLAQRQKDHTSILSPESLFLPRKKPHIRRKVIGRKVRLRVRTR
jgi:hypothetical protein